MRQLKKTAISIAATQVALLCCGAAFAQASSTAQTDTATDGKAPAATLQTVVISGQRRALQSAQQRKQDADEVVDSVVAEEIGKLPDRSVAEVLQRVVGVTMNRTAAASDPVHYSVEGSGVNIRGLTYVSSQLNGRETFSANGGRTLGFEDVPPELVAGVDVYKNPSVEQIEGAIGGMVNLRTALPLDFKGFKFSGSASSTYNQLNGSNKPATSAMISNVWDTDLGKFGALIDVAHSEGSSRTEKLIVDPFYYTTKQLFDASGQPIHDAAWNVAYQQDGSGHLFPGAMSWGVQQYDRTRDGLYGALQWKKNDMESSLTYFRSKYDFAMTENNVKNTPDPYHTVVSNATWGPNGQMLTGVLSNPSQGGMEVEAETRFNHRTSQTEELAWKFAMKPAERWNLSSDVQYITSKTQAFDSTVSAAVLMPKETIDLTGSLPKVSFDGADATYLANQSNYYWATTMEHLDKGTATQKAIRADAKYSFEDNNPYLRDLRFGARAVERSAVNMNSNPSYNWAPVTHAWQVGPNPWNDTNSFATVTNYSSPTYLQSFNGFLGGRTSLPSLYFPAMSVAQGFPGSYSTLHQYYDSTCLNCWYKGWKPTTLGVDPAGTNDQNERTYTGYTQLRFGFDELKYPVDGNVGLRVIRTEEKANGYTILNVTAPNSGTTGTASFPSIQPITGIAETASNSYTDVLPSLNLKMKVRDDLLLRFAASKGISRPTLDKLQAYNTMTLAPKTEGGALTGYTLTGTASGNPMLTPVKSTQEDVTSEWYFSKTGSLTMAAFNKDIKDIIIDQTFAYKVYDTSGVPYNVVMTGPTNGADGYARGVELAYQQYFDKLPGWMSGFGLQANYTFVDSKLKRRNAVASANCSAGNGANNLNLFINGCDTDGRSFGDTPLPNLSRNAFNLALLYDRGPISARVAYSWRDKYLYGVALNSDNTGPNQQNGLDTTTLTPGNNKLPIGLPLWAQAYGELDASIEYKLSDNLKVSLEGKNLTDAFYKQMMQQHTGMNDHSYFTSGRRYTVSMQYSF
jgi:TonB-dependent receptor